MCLSPFKLKTVRKLLRHFFLSGSTDKQIKKQNENYMVGHFHIGVCEKEKIFLLNMLVEDVDDWMRDIKRTELVCWNRNQFSEKQNYFKLLRRPLIENSKQIIKHRK